MAGELEAFADPSDAARSRPSRGPAWAAAIELGIDVTLLEHSLKLRPFERLRRADEHARFAHRVHSRRLSRTALEALQQRRLEEKLIALGLTVDEILLDDGRAD